MPPRSKRVTDVLDAALAQPPDLLQAFQFERRRDFTGRRRPAHLLLLAESVYQLFSEEARSPLRSVRARERFRGRWCWWYQRWLRRIQFRPSLQIPQLLEDRPFQRVAVTRPVALHLPVVLDEGTHALHLGVQIVQVV